MIRMKRIISITLISAVIVMTGCLGMPTESYTPPEQDWYPPEEELISRVTEFVDGENIEYLGNYRFRSLDRDLEFCEGWSLVHSESMYGYVSGRAEIDSNSPSESDINRYGGGPNYRVAVARYWAGYIQDLMDEHDFDESYINPEMSRFIQYLGELDVFIYISHDVTDEQLADITDMLIDLRDICRAENEFHTEGEPRGYYIEFHVEVYFQEEGQREYAPCGHTWITASTSDEECDVNGFIDFSSDWYADLDYDLTDRIWFAVYD